METARLDRSCGKNGVENISGNPSLGIGNPVVGQTILEAVSKRLETARLDRSLGNP